MRSVRGRWGERGEGATSIGRYTLRIEGVPFSSALSHHEDETPHDISKVNAYLHVSTATINGAEILKVWLIYTFNVFACHWDSGGSRPILSTKGRENTLLDNLMQPTK